MPRRLIKAGNGNRVDNTVRHANGDYNRNSYHKNSNNKINNRDHQDKSQLNFLLDRINVGIIEELVNNGDVKSSEIAEKLKIPLSTIQRRRSNLEKLSVIKKTYTVDLKRLSLRIAEIMVGSERGDSQKIMNEVYNKHKNNIVNMSLRVGNPDTNVSFRLTYKTSLELFEVLEDVKEMETVNSVTWSEYISEKRNSNSSFLDLLTSS